MWFIGGVQCVGLRSLVLTFSSSNSLYYTIFYYWKLYFNVLHTVYTQHRSSELPGPAHFRDLMLFAGLGGPINGIHIPSGFAVVTGPINYYCSITYETYVLITFFYLESL